MEELYRKRLHTFVQSQNHPPPQFPRPLLQSGIGPSDWGNGGWKMQKDARKREREDSPPTGLGLRLELGSGSSQRHEARPVLSGFTYTQMHELQQQSLVYKYIEAGLHVPPHLIHSIFKNVSGSYHLRHPNPYPTPFGYSPLHWDSKYRGDLEPWRCRRTDGKKWRCSRQIVPDRKYCERHVHRGRYRLRKLGEALPSSEASSATTNIGNDCTQNREILNLNPSINLSISLPSTSESKLNPPCSVQHGL